MSPNQSRRWKPWDRVALPTGDCGRVVCLGDGRALVWRGLGKGEHWYDLGDLGPTEPLQQELFNAN